MFPFIPVTNHSWFRSATMSARMRCFYATMTSRVNNFPSRNERETVVTVYRNRSLFSTYIFILISSNDICNRKNKHTQRHTIEYINVQKLTDRYRTLLMVFGPRFHLPASQRFHVHLNHHRRRDQHRRQNFVSLSKLDKR